MQKDDDGESEFSYVRRSESSASMSNQYNILYLTRKIPFLVIQITQSSLTSSLHFNQKLEVCGVLTSNQHEILNFRDSEDERLQFNLSL